MEPPFFFPSFALSLSLSLFYYVPLFDGVLHCVCVCVCDTRRRQTKKKRTKQKKFFLPFAHKGEGRTLRRMGFKLILGLCY